jgi:hypothetical protein
MALAQAKATINMDIITLKEKNPRRSKCNGTFCLA